MTNSINALNAVEPKKLEKASEQQSAQKEKVETSLWEEAKVYAKGFAKGFIEFYPERFEGTEGVGDALKRTWDILNEGWEIADDCPLGVKHWIKKGCQKVSEKVDTLVSDNDPNTMTVGEKVWNATKGVGDVADSIVSVKGVTIAAGAGLVAIGAVAGATAAVGTVSATAAASIPSAITVGTGAYGAYKTGEGIYDVATAENEQEARSGGGEIAVGGLMVGGSLASAKASLQCLKDAGVDVPDPSTLSAPKAYVENVKGLAKAAPKIAAETKATFGALSGTTASAATGETVIKAGSPELEKGVKYMSKANDVQAYRFNPNGTEEEILANNPGVFKNADGQYCIPNKWNPEQPYIIDASKEQMIMMYGGDDMAVCDGAVFKGSYVDTAGFKSSGSLSYQDPSTLEYGKVVNVTKQAPGSFVEMPVGTKVQTLEGMRTVGEGDVVAVDCQGNPYVTTMKNILKRNMAVPGSEAEFENLAAYKAELPPSTYMTEQGPVTKVGNLSVKGTSIDPNLHAEYAEALKANPALKDTAISIDMSDPAATTTHAKLTINGVSQDVVITHNGFGHLYCPASEYNWGNYFERDLNFDKLFSGQMTSLFGK